ncbi:50S ribosomal protein L4 [Candidatus Saccharibacteria bacterium]|nr:50S ribosomal protein L4 [Candidatus Saccharibacteria bacterium]
MKALTFTRTGTKSAETTLVKAIFESDISEDLLKQSVVRSHSNLRQGNAKTLTRGEVRGGGRKPWKQKGTGRARFGSSRVNIWRHGGIAHGPTGLQNYQKDMPTSMIRASVRMALSTQADKVVIIEKLAISEPKTKVADALLAKLNLTGNVLLIVAEFDEKFTKASANLPGVRQILFSQLRSYDVLSADAIVIEKPALEKIEIWLKVKK